MRARSSRLELVEIGGCNVVMSVIVSSGLSLGVMIDISVVMNLQRHINTQIKGLQNS